MSRRLALVASIVCVLVALPAAAQAAPGAALVLVTANQPGVAATVASAIDAQPGIASASSFDTSGGTPSAADLAGKDLVVSVGDSSYNDSTLWGNRLADYVDAGGTVLQTAYDNWEGDDPSDDPAPKGRFASGGYPPLLLGDNANLAVTLGSILVPSSPLVQGLGSFANSSNNTTPLAPGATLLARWSDGRNAIAIKGRVVAVSASPDSTDTGLAGVARLAGNTANFVRRYRVGVVKAGAGTGTVNSSPPGISCGAICSAAVPFANRVTLTATAGTDSRFAGWFGACSGTGPCTRTIAGADVNVGATFVSTRRCGNPRTGTNGPDNLVGSAFPDRLTGLRGNDLLRGLAGQDCLAGNSGRDRLFGGASRDNLSGGASGDRLSGDSGNDNLSGGTGNDRLSGGRGSDHLSGSTGRDRLSGGSGRDRLFGGSSNDRLSGDSGNDRITAGGGRNRVSGGSGKDLINTANGRRDRVNCGSGRDRVRADRIDRLRRCERVRRV